MSSDKQAKRRKRSIIESCDNPTPREVYRAALAYRRAGLSFIPISADMSKEPATNLLPQVWCEHRKRQRRTWRTFTERQPTKEEIKKWFIRKCDSPEYGLAIVGGKVSRGLEILDLDTFDLIEPFKLAVEERSPGLLDRLPQVMTPRPGSHFYYRCSVIEGNQKLARIQDPGSDKPKPKTIIETKGEGGYCLAPPSPDWCHPKQSCYTFVGDKDLTQIPTITPEERQVLLDAARSLDRWSQTRPSPPRRSYVAKRARPGSLRPGDEFNERVEWTDILTPHGWTYEGPGGEGSDYWTRPGKGEGCSATTGHAGLDLLYVFSSNAEPFEEGTAYTKFHAYTLLEHDGDFSEAALELRRRGYGRKTKVLSRRRSRTRRQARKRRP